MILIRKNPVKNFRSQKKNTKKMTLVRIRDEFAKCNRDRGRAATLAASPLCVCLCTFLFDRHENPISLKTLLGKYAKVENP